MRILLSNDDGIEAPGLERLRAVAAAHGEVTVVAPDEERSGCSHGISGQAPLAVHQLAPGRYSCSGLPSDCARFGLGRVCREPDLVLGGINRGGNLGVDLFLSGTVSVAREAAMQGRPGIAFSQHLRGEPDWDQAERLAALALRHILTRGTPTGWFWNVNLPYEPVSPEPPIVETSPDESPLPLEWEETADGSFVYGGRYNDRPRQPGRDVDVCFSGRISISLICGRPR